MALVDYITRLHTSTSRDYVARVTEADKAECAEIAKQWGRDYWDGDRKYGYGGYTYDGRWRPVAEIIAKAYGLKAGDRVLDIGCGKAFLLFELSQAVPGLIVDGIDISEYGIENAKPEIRDRLRVGIAQDLPYEDDSFDFVYSINTFHNLTNFELANALSEFLRVGKTDRGYVAVESYRDEREKANLLYWQLTCEAFLRPEEWTWLYEQAGYAGDYEFIYFE